MANIRWTGQATAVAQVDTFTPSGTTVTTAKLGSGGSITYDPARVTLTNKLQPYAAVRMERT